MQRRLEQVRLSDIDLEDTTFMSRLDFDEEKIESLAEDIRRFGQRNPIGLRENEGRLQVIYGWNRIKAVQLLGRDEIEARNYGEMSDLEAQLHNIQDNAKHEDLTPLEVAFQVKALKEVHKLGVERIVEIYDVKKSTIYNLLSLTEMDEEIKQAVHLENIELTHALKISRFPISNRLELLRRTIDEGLSVSKLDGILRGEAEPRSAEEVMVHRELDRFRKFLFTQIDSGEDFKEGVTRESLTEWYVSILKNYQREGNKSLLTLMELINNYMYSIIFRRLFASLDKPYNIRNMVLYEWLVEKGFRRDYPPFEVIEWFFYEYTRYNARYCSHKWVTEEEGWVNEEGSKSYGFCEHCAIDKSRVDEIAARRWVDPPYEDPPIKPFSRLEKPVEATVTEGA